MGRGRGMGRGSVMRLGAPVVLPQCVQDGQWLMPRQVLLCKHPRLRQLVPPDVLMRGLGKRFAHPSVLEVLQETPALRKALALPTLDWDALMDLLRMGLKPPPGTEPHVFAGDWLVCLHDMIEGEGLPLRVRGGRWDQLRSVPLLPVQGKQSLVAASQQVSPPPRDSLGPVLGDVAQGGL